MKVYHLATTWGIENLVMKDIDTPTPASQEVVVEVKAISINPVDAKVRAMSPVLSMICGVEDDVILWRDIAWVVSSVGEAVTDFSIGDRVFGMVNFPGVGHAYAEYVACPAAHLAMIPDSSSFEDAAASTLAALTALQALEGKVKEWDKVLIHAGSWWVGHFAIQLAKHYGATVITTCSSKNRDFVLWLWADEHIDYKTIAFEETLSDIDFVLDTLGWDNASNSLWVIRDGGILISLPAPLDESIVAKAAERNIDASFILVASQQKDIQTIAGFLADGTLKPHVSQTFSFDELAASHTAIESGRTVGKIVVTL